MDSELEALLNSAKINLSGKKPDQHDGIDIADEAKEIVSSIPKLQTTIKTDEKDQKLETAKQLATDKPIKSIALRNEKAKKPDTAGKQWFDLGKPEMTTELKRDLALLKMRHVLDPKRFYKKEDAPMKYFAVGTIKEDPTEFFSGRLSRKERKRTLAEEVLSTRSDYFKGKYRDIQKAKTSGRRKHQKKLRDMRA